MDAQTESKLEAQANEALRLYVRDAENRNGHIRMCLIEAVDETDFWNRLADRIKAISYSRAQQEAKSSLEALQFVWSYRDAKK